MRFLRSVLVFCIMGFLLGAPVTSAAQTTADAAIAEIVESIESSGRFVDSAASNPAPGVTAAMDRANAAGVAVVLADPAADVEPLSEAIDQAMIAGGSRYSTVFVLTPQALAAQSNASEGELGAALDAAFGESDDAGVIDAFVQSLTGSGGGLPAPSTDTPAADDSSSASGDAAADDSGGGGFGGWFWGIVAAIAGFFGIRYFSNKRKRKARAKEDLETDRHEIAEQLRNNADRMIGLGDTVIASKDAELIALYEEASTTYQEVSLALPEATTAAEIDALDDRIDNAEWQFEVIEARVAGKPDPPSPAEQERAANPPPPSGPALGADESIFDRNGRPSSPSGRSMPPPPRRIPAPRRTQQRSSRSGGFGGGFLGGILGQILLGGGRSRTTSRRTQRRSSSGRSSSGRSSSGTSWGGRRSSGGSSIPGPFSRSSRSRSSRRSGGSRSRRRSGGARARSGGSRRR